jgi:hypothetical protein
MHIKKLSNFLTESRNLHLEHVEDSVFENGKEIREALRFLASLRNMLTGNETGGIGLTVKWDGAPAIFCGTNPENGKFFVGTKSVFNKDPKINYTAADIRRNHSGGLTDKLEVALKHLKKLNIKTVLQGDMMFTSDDIIKKKIGGDSYLTFTPNTITYAIPEKSLLGRKIAKSKIGIVFHTEYKGDTFETMKASFAPVLKLAKPAGVWYDDATFKDHSGTVTLSGSESSEFDKEFEMAKRTFLKQKSFYDKLDPELRKLGKIYINSKVRAGTQDASIGEFVDFVNRRHQAEIQKAVKPATQERKQKVLNDLLDRMKKDKNGFESLFALFRHLINLKNLILPTLNSIKGNMRTFVKTPSGFKVTAPEGYVSVDRMSNKAFKIVDRLEFSKNNFTVAKDWIK